MDDCLVAEKRLDFEKAIPVELHAGGILLFSPLLPHQTHVNRSPHRRRALQLFYRAAHTREVSAEEFNSVFLEEDGTPASCSAAGEAGTDK